MNGGDQVSTSTREGEKQAHNCLMADRETETYSVVLASGHYKQSSTTWYAGVKAWNNSSMTCQHIITRHGSDIIYSYLHVSRLNNISITKPYNRHHITLITWILDRYTHLIGALAYMVSWPNQAVFAQLKSIVPGLPQKCIFVNNENFQLLMTLLKKRQLGLNRWIFS